MTIFQDIIHLLNTVVFCDTIALIVINLLVWTCNMVEMKQKREGNEGSSLLLPGKASVYNSYHASNQNKEEIQKTPSLNALNQV